MPDKTTAFTVVGARGGPFSTERIDQDVDLVGLHLNYRWGG
ncbi:MULTISPECIES: hypothetical protein [unclassified Mesorhizobium]|nr:MULTISPECIES: hypothetical protein [unclassified Mesorhizobium]